MELIHKDKFWPRVKKKTIGNHQKLSRSKVYASVATLRTRITLNIPLPVY